MTYKQVAEFAGRPRAYRAVANILGRNRNSKIPCHRVIRNDYTIGGYLGSEKLSWKKAALLLKDGAVGVIPTDTIYGICASALGKRAVEKVYELKKRDRKKPMIILISSPEDLKGFNIRLKTWQKKFLKKFWPGPVSIILPCPSKKFAYLRRGAKSLSFRLPKKPELLKMLSISGPLVAPSANWEGHPPAKNIAQARQYFGKNVFYYDKGDLTGSPSTLIDLTQEFGKTKILRK